MIRRQLPALSPLTAGALLAGALPRGTSGRLTELLQQRYRSHHVVLTDSGTGALTLALAAAIAGRPAPLIALPAYGCYDLATAALGVGGGVVLYDVDPDTLSPALGSLERALDRKPHAVIAAHWYGVPFDTEALSRRVTDAGAVLVEDAAQAFGASVDGRACGAIARWEF